MKSLISFILIILSGNSFLFSQSAPAPAQSQPILINGARLHVGNGTIVENSIIAFENGKLTMVADARTVRIDGSKNYRVIDATGKEIFPGFIAPNTSLGLTEINAVRSTRDFRETGLFNPSVRAIIAYNTDSKIIPTIRSNGILLAQIVPSGGRISGQSSIVQLDAWNWEDAVYHSDEGVHLNWPARFRFRGRRRGANLSPNENYGKQVGEIERFFEEALAYSKQEKTEKKNLKLEAVHGLFDQSQTLYIHTDQAKSIMEAVGLAEQFGMRAVIVGGHYSWMVIDFLKTHNTPVLLHPAQSLPRHSDDDIDQPFKTAAALHKAGILFGFCGQNGSWQQRNLPFQAGQAVGFGLDYEAAISSLSLNTAKILGIDESTGSLEIGKDATLFICEGDPLDMRTHTVQQAFIQGREIDLNNKQKELYRKFKDKYDQK